MFEIRRNEHGQMLFCGRLDASQAEKARAALADITGSATLDLGGLEYISSAGLGVLLEAQKRLSESGQGLTLTGLSKHIEDLFRVAGFDSIFDIV